MSHNFRLKTFYESAGCESFRGMKEFNQGGFFFLPLNFICPAEPNSSQDSLKPVRHAFHAATISKQPPGWQVELRLVAQVSGRLGVSSGLLTTNRPRSCSTKHRSTGGDALAEAEEGRKTRGKTRELLRSACQELRETRARCCVPRILCRCVRGSHVFLLLRSEEGVSGVRGVTVTLE